MCCELVNSEKSQWVGKLQMTDDGRRSEFARKGRNDTTRRASSAYILSLFSRGRTASIYKLQS